MNRYQNRETEMRSKTRRKRSLETDTDLLITCGENAHQFLIQSGVHGMRYVGDTKLTLFERLFFTAAIAIMFGLAVYFISNVYYKWSGAPIIFTFNPKSHPINEIPFPAVTICNMNQARKSVARNLTKGSKEYHMLRSLCRYDIDENADSVNDTNWEMFRELIIKVSQPCNELLVICKFATKYQECLNIFGSVLTDEGLCCTFNSANNKYILKNPDSADDFDGLNDTKSNRPISWTPEQGFSEREWRRVYPRRAFGSGSNMGLSLMINAQSDDYYCSSTQSTGFKVLLHLPTELPKISNLGFAISPGRENYVVIHPSISDASEQIRSIPIENRKCMFENENNLSYFKIYSQKNCQMECESRLLQRACGCVMYYMPRFGENPVICDREDWKCYTDVLYSIQMETNKTFRCDCLPGCFDVSFTASVTTAAIIPEMIYMEKGRYNATSREYTLANMAIMHVYFTDKFFISLSKEELIGFTDFVSNVGGLMGLFLGFSVLSLIEIMYFITIRPYCALRLRKRRLTKRRHSLILPDNQRIWNIEQQRIRRVLTISTDINSRTYYEHSKFDGYIRRNTLEDNDRRVYLD